MSMQRVRPAVATETATAATTRSAATIAMELSQEAAVSAAAGPSMAVRLHEKLCQLKAARDQGMQNLRRVNQQLEQERQTASGLRRNMHDLEVKFVGADAREREGHVSRRRCPCSP